MTLTPNKNGTYSTFPLHLVGVGMRRKNLFVVEVDVYMTGLGLSKSAVKNAQAWKKASNQSSSLADVVVNTIENNGNPIAYVPLRFVRDVTTSQIVEAFNDAFKGIDPNEIAIFKVSLGKTVGSDGMKTGETVNFFWMDGGGLMITKDGKPPQTLRSDVLEKRLLEVYVDPKICVSRELVASIDSHLGDVAV